MRLPLLCSRRCFMSAILFMCWRMCRRYYTPQHSTAPQQQLHNTLPTLHNTHNTQITQKRIVDMHNWVICSPSLKGLDPTFRSLLVFFSQPPSPETPAKSGKRKGFFNKMSGLSSSASGAVTGSSYLSLSPTSSAEHVLVVQLLVHMAAVTFATGGMRRPNEAFSLFHTLISKPSTLVGSFLPVQPEDMTAMAAKVLVK